MAAWGAPPWRRLSLQWAFRVPPLGILWAGGQQCTHCEWKDVCVCWGGALPKGRKTPTSLEAGLDCPHTGGTMILCDADGIFIRYGKVLPRLSFAGGGFSDPVSHSGCRY